MKKITFSISIFLISITGFTQTYSGYNTGNYTGVNGVFFNLANIADSRYRWDINLASVNATGLNDYASIKTSNISKIFNGDNLDSVITRTGVANANVFKSIVDKDNFSGDTYLRHGTGQIMYGSSGLTDNKYKIDISGSGIGADVGLVYEYRPDEYTPYGIDQYKFKAEIAFHDIGS